MNRTLSNEDLEDIEYVLVSMGKAEEIPFNGKVIKLQVFIRNVKQLIRYYDAGGSRISREWFEQ